MSLAILLLVFVSFLLTHNYLSHPIHFSNYTNLMPLFFNGTVRKRLPVAR